MHYGNESHYSQLVQKTSKALAKLNVPHELIGNPDRWQEMTKLLNPEDKDRPDLPELPESLPDDEELYGLLFIYRLRNKRHCQYVPKLERRRRLESRRFIPFKTK
ncbi:hypothetical protein HOLleu_43445 [Holothuria leucospilota]|uniref:Uncharacterized protein n=1 Tax=Holothuria leucospilota TaxID=206669 RepID=A0A9Q0Y9J7_HOLLE|nr:hypothetical protein HOLleu_43445 [Holothuria leucospilota]